MIRYVNPCARPRIDVAGAVRYTQSIGIILGGHRFAENTNSGTYRKLCLTTRIMAKTQCGTRAYQESQS